MLNALGLRLRGSSTSEDARSAAAPATTPPAPPADGGPPAQPSNAPSASAAGAEIVALTASGEVGAIEAKTASSLITMASVRAGELPPAADGATRTPLEVVAVVDVSGSMAGAKMSLMKEALSFVVQKGLQAGDSLGIVTFASDVDVDLKLTQMDARGKKDAQRVVDALHTKGQTNLSGGLLQGLDMVAQRAKGRGWRGGASASAAGGVTRSIILFTDGMANLGITDTPRIVAAAKQALPAIGSGCAIFTFGFGSEHNEDMLRALSEAAPGGQYFFTKSAEEIPVAFADALGGLVSVVAQNAELRIAPTAPGVRIERLLGSSGYAHELKADGSELVVKLGDLYAEDEKDLLCAVGVPALSGGAQHDEAREHVRLSLRYFDVPRGAFATVEATLALARPEAAPAEQAPNSALEVQRNRIAAAEALDAATKMADEGRLDAGRELLKAAQQQLKESPVADAELCASLAQELEEISDKYQNEQMYRAEGRRGTKMAMQTHMVQRSAMASGAAYEKKSKKAMKGAWFSGGS